MNAPPPAASASVSLLAIYRVFFRIGVFSFGGGLIPWIQREVVTMRGWMTNDEFLPGVALAQVMPGVNSANLAIFIGQRLRGMTGALVALCGLLTGPFLVMMAATSVYQQILGIKPLQVAMAGVAAAAIGMILRTGLGAARASLSGIAPVGVMVVTFVAIGVMKWPLLWVVAIMSPLSIALAWPRTNRQENRGGDDA